MANQTPSRIGQINAAGDVDAIFLKVFAGETITAFRRKSAMLGRHMTRTITSGKSAQFPVSGRATAQYHTPGNEILGGTINHNEKVIIIDDVLMSPVFVSDIDEAKNHYDIRGELSFQTGEALANQMDKHLLQVGVLAARTATGNTTDLPGGTVITETVLNDYDDPDLLVEGLFTAAQTLDENDVPEGDRYAFFKPVDYYRLVKAAKAINRDFGGRGSFADGTVFNIAGLDIIKTNNLPSTNVTTATVAAGTGDRYLGDFTKVRGLVMHKGAIGTVKLRDLNTRMDYDPRRDGVQILAKYAMGHGVLRPEAAVELRNF